MMRRIILPMVIVLVTGFACANADAQLWATPLTGGSVVYEMDRYSVQSPQGKDWFELKRDKQDAFFGKKLVSRTHSFIAIATSGPIAEKFSNPDDYRDYVGRLQPVQGDRRTRVFENQVETDNSLGRFCVRYRTKATDRDAIHAGGKTLFAETFGVSCLHPDNPALLIDVSYTERGHPTEFSAALRAEGDSFVRSLKFISR